MKHKSLDDLKKNLEALNNLKTLVIKFSIPPQPKIALFQSLVDEDIHTMLNILSKYIQGISPPESLLLSFNPTINPSPTLPHNSINPSQSLYPSYPVSNQLPATSLQFASSPPISSTLNQPQAQISTSTSTSTPTPTPTPTPDPALSQILATDLTRPIPYPRQSNPAPGQLSSNPLPQPLFRSATSIDVQVHKCTYCGESNPIQDCLIRCKCGYNYCNLCLKVNYECTCHETQSRKIQPKYN
jgi:hypothetical protein